MVENGLRNRTGAVKVRLFESVHGIGVLTLRYAGSDVYESSSKMLVDATSRSFWFLSTRIA